MCIQRRPVSRQLTLPFRPAQRDEPGIAFIEFLDQQVDHDRRARSRQLAFIHEWDYLIDEDGQLPTPKRYAERWNTPTSTVYLLLTEFRRLFPGEADPTRVCQALWAAVEAQQDAAGTFVDMDRVRVVQQDGG
jgi:hypothetical protein